MEVTLSQFSPVHAIIGNQSAVEISSQHYDLALCPPLLWRADKKASSMRKVCSFDKTATEDTSYYIVQCPYTNSHISFFSEGSSKKKVFPFDDFVWSLSYNLKRVLN